MKRQLILASASPRRRELLGGIAPFRTEPSAFEERSGGLFARETAMAFARGKALEVLARFPEALVLGADTVVSFRGEILGKPKDPAEAVSVLRLLSWNTHAVITGVCLAGK